MESKVLTYLLCTFLNKHKITRTVECSQVSVLMGMVLLDSSPNTQSKVVGGMSLVVDNDDLLANFNCLSYLLYELLA